MKTQTTLKILREDLRDDDRKPFLLEFRKEDHRTRAYGDLARDARRLAWGLRRKGIAPGDAVGLFAPFGYDWAVVCLWVLQAGAMVMPLDLQIESETLAGILKDSDPACVFAKPEQKKQLREAETDRLAIYTLDGPDGESNSWKRLLIEDEQALPDLSADHRAALFYTSGTTGPPKGVPLNHGHFAFQIKTLRETGLITPDDRVLLPLPPHHVYPFVIGILAPLSLGLTIVRPYSLTGPQMVRALREGDATLLLGVPRLYDALFAGITARFESNAIFRSVFNKGLEADITLRRKIGLSPGRCLLRPLRRQFGPRLRIMASGGAPLSSELALKLEAVGWQVAIGYGLTETAPLLCLKLPGDPHLDTVGRPVKGVRIRIDPEALPEAAEEQDPLEKGEILAKGPNIFTGYHNLPDKTDAAFTEDGWFRTGDLGYLDPEGYLHVTGRVSTLIVTQGGENIQPDDVEAHLEAHALIREAGVLQLKSGELAAVVAPETKEIRTQDIKERDRAVHQAVAERSQGLPSYQRVTEIAVTRAPLPRTRLGKIRRHFLADVFRYFSHLSRTVPIDPDKGIISSMAFAAAVLNRDQGLVWFPEGRRSPDGRLQPFKIGIGILLEHYPVPVIPAFIRGTYRILPTGKAIPRRGTISLAFGQPLDAAELDSIGEGEEKSERIASALQAKVAQLGERMRT